LNEAIERLRQEFLSQALDGSLFRLCYDQSDLRPLPSNTFRRSQLDQQIREERRLAAPPLSPAVRDGVFPQTPAAVCVERRDVASPPHHSPVSKLRQFAFVNRPGRFSLPARVDAFNEAYSLIANSAFHFFYRRGGDKTLAGRRLSDADLF
jgi:hypothetical protein